MESANTVRNISLLLTFVAGFCDTVTFLAADEVFSAHVTGNFIVFAHDVVVGSDAQAWTRLITFPVFFAAVMTGGWIAHKSADHYLLLCLEGLLLLAGGALAFVLPVPEGIHSWPVLVVTMIVVCAMGFQNAFGRLYGKETYGPTTVMTGTVTQAALDLTGSLTTRFTDPGKWESLKKQVVLIIGFLFGCLLGAVAARFFGLAIVLFPGVMLIALFAGTKPVKALQSNA
jgi:uncharacterized membrane protein YoaK (UPF0700 family)